MMCINVYKSIYYMQRLDPVPNLIFSALVTFPEGDTGVQ